MPLKHGIIERDLREYLENSGYFGRSAEFADLRLVAVERPGWVQIFSFDVRAKHRSDGWVRLHGACRDDDRYGKFDVVLTEEPEVRGSRVEEWSAGLITLRRVEPHWVRTLLMSVFAIVFLLVIVAALTKELMS